MKEATKCPFCGLGPEVIVLEDELGIALRDRYPVANGHTLVVPRRHVESVFALSDEEIGALWRLVSRVRAALQQELGTTAFTIGVNDGDAAGQTVPHGHIHVIPRSSGDVQDPRGGIRWVIPRLAPYWETGA